MGLLYLRHGAEAGGQLGEALFLGGLREALVHVGPLEVLPVRGGGQVLGGVADAFQFLEPELGVLLLVLGGLEEYLRYLLKAVLLGPGCEVSVLVARLGFAREGGLKVFFGLGARVFVCHDLSSYLCSARIVLPRVIVFSSARLRLLRLGAAVVSFPQGTVYRHVLVVLGGCTGKYQCAGARFSRAEVQVIVA